MCISDHRYTIYPQYVLLNQFVIERLTEISNHCFRRLFTGHIASLRKKMVIKLLLVDSLIVVTGPDIDAPTITF